MKISRSRFIFATTKRKNLAIYSFFFWQKNHSQTFAMSSEPQFGKEDFVNVCVTWFDALTLFMRSKHEILYEKWISKFSSPSLPFHQQFRMQEAFSEITSWITLTWTCSSDRMQTRRQGTRWELNRSSSKFSSSSRLRGETAIIRASATT